MHASAAGRILSLGASLDGLPPEKPDPSNHNLEVGLLADRVLEATRRFRRGNPRSSDARAFERADTFLDAVLELEDADLDSMLDRSISDRQLSSFSVSISSAIEFVPRPDDDLFAEIRHLKEILETGLEEERLSEEAAEEINNFFGNISEAMLANDAEYWGS